MSKGWSVFLVSLIAAMMMLAPMLAGAYTTGTALGGTVVTINAGPGDQTDPHVSGDLAAYTSDVKGAVQIRYFIFNSSGGGTDFGIANSNGGVQTIDQLSDVSGNTIVFTRFQSGSSSIWFAVAPMKTGAVFSCIHVRKCARTRDAEPPRVF